MIITCISSKEILILFLLVPLMSTGMVNLTQQSKACHGNSNSVFQDNGSTLDTNGKTTARRHQAISLLKLLAIIKFQAAGRGTLHALMENILATRRFHLVGLWAKYHCTEVWEVIAVDSKSGNSLNQGGSFHSGVSEQIITALMVVKYLTGFVEIVVLVVIFRPQLPLVDNAGKV